MHWLMEFLRPEGALNVWAIRATLVFWSPLLVVWALALILSRCKFLFGEDPLFRVYFGWVVPLLVYSVTLGVFVILFSKEYRQDSRNFSFSMFPLVPFIVCCVATISLTTLMGRRVSRLKKLRR